MNRLARASFVLCAVLAAAATTRASAQIIDFDSGGLKYQALSKDGLTIMVAPLQSSIREYTVVQIAVANGSRLPYVLRPEDFVFTPASGAEIAALPARTVINSLIDRASKSDVVALVNAYEAGLYGQTHYQATHGFEQRRLSAMTAFTSTRLKAAATASALAFVQTKLAPGQSTDGAVFYNFGGKPLGAGVLRVRAGTLLFEFPMVPSN